MLFRYPAYIIKVMKKEVLKNLFIAFLLGLSVFTVFRHLSVLREKLILADTLKQKEAEVTGLQGELVEQKEAQRVLLQQKNGLRSYLEASKRRLLKLFGEFGKAKGSIRELDGKIIILKTENQELLQEKNRLAEENQGYRAKLSSVDELKKAIRDIKTQPRKPKIYVSKVPDKEKTVIQGNQGFLLKDGKPTPPAKIVIEVVPAPTKE